MPVRQDPSAGKEKWGTGAHQLQHRDQAAVCENEEGLFKMG